MSLFIIASLAMGVLISVMAKTQMQAMQMSFFIILPTFIVRLYVSREAMPAFFSALVIYYLQVTFYLQIMRGIILKELALIWEQVLHLWHLSLLFTTISIKIQQENALRYSVADPIKVEISSTRSRPIKEFLLCLFFDSEFFSSNFKYLF